MKNQPISEINPMITLDYLQSKEENQYFEKKGLGEKGIKPTKIADELGMLNADGGVVVLGVSDNGTIQDLQKIQNELDKYRSLVFDFAQPTPDIKLKGVIVNNNLIFLYHVEQELESVFERRNKKNY